MCQPPPPRAGTFAPRPASAARADHISPCSSLVSRVQVLPQKSNRHGWLEVCLSHADIGYPDGHSLSGSSSRSAKQLGMLGLAAAAALGKGSSSGLDSLMISHAFGQLGAEVRIGREWPWLRESVHVVRNAVAVAVTVATDTADANAALAAGVSHLDSLASLRCRRLWLAIVNSLVTCSSIAQSGLTTSPCYLLCGASGPTGVRDLLRYNMF